MAETRMESSQRLHQRTQGKGTALLVTPNVVTWTGGRKPRTLGKNDRCFPTYAYGPEVKVTYS